MTTHHVHGTPCAEGCHASRRLGGPAMMLLGFAGLGFALRQSRRESNRDKARQQWCYPELDLCTGDQVRFAAWTGPQWWGFVLLARFRASKPERSEVLRQIADRPVL